MSSTQMRKLVIASKIEKPVTIDSPQEKLDILVVYEVPRRTPRHFTDYARDLPARRTRYRTLIKTGLEGKPWTQ